MIAYMTKDGVLDIAAENDLEAYALDMWLRNFNCGVHSSVLRVNAVKAESPEE